MKKGHMVKNFSDCSIVSNSCFNDICLYKRLASYASSQDGRYQRGDNDRYRIRN